jgi:hypothetical protein
MCTGQLYVYLSHFGAVTNYILFCPEVSRWNYLQDLGVDGTIIFKWIFRKEVSRNWIGFMWFRIEAVGGIL